MCGLLECGPHMSAVAPALPLAPRSRLGPELVPGLSTMGENPKQRSLTEGLAPELGAEGRTGLTPHAAASLPPLSPTPQNNQLEKIYPEELSRLHLLETLNLQNNRLTSRGEGSPRAWDGATWWGIGHPWEEPPLAVPGMWQKAGLGWAGRGSWVLTKSHPGCL